MMQGTTASARRSVASAPPPPAAARSDRGRSGQTGASRDRRASKRGARLLVQVAANPACRLMTVAAAAGLPLPALAAGPGAEVGEPGEGVSRLAMANGNRFENALWRDGRLVEALIEAKLLRANPVIADYRQDKRSVDRLEREVLGYVLAAARGDCVPDLLCHPPLRLEVARDFSVPLVPDYLRLVPAATWRSARYVAGELKAFHDLDGETDPAALLAAERQVAAYDLALDRALAALTGGGDGADRADLVLRRPRARDLRPALRPDIDTRPHKARLLRAALPALARAHAEVVAHRAAYHRDPDLTTLPTNLIEPCANLCAAYDWCLQRARETGDLRAFGEADRFSPAATVAEALAALSLLPGDDDPPAPPNGELAALAERLAARAAWVARLRPVPDRAGRPPEPGP